METPLHIASREGLLDIVVIYVIYMDDLKTKD